MALWLCRLLASAMRLTFSPAITDDFRVWLAAQKGGQRALALLQVGNWTRAARELRYLVEEMPPAFQRDLIAFATRNHMPGLAFRLADLHQRDTGEQIYAALYPLLSEKTDFVVDEALVLAIIRKESGFIHWRAAAHGQLA